MKKVGLRDEVPVIQRITINLTGEIHVTLVHQGMMTTHVMGIVQAVLVIPAAERSALMLIQR
jgi:hypothetical protein